jgi:hypothetical protein
MAILAGSRPADRWPPHFRHSDRRGRCGVDRRIRRHMADLIERNIKTMRDETPFAEQTGMFREDQRR